MNRTAFEEMEKLHNEWSKMDSITKLAHLAKEKTRLNEIANLFALQIRAKGGFSNATETDYACKLLQLMDTIDREGQKVTRDVAYDEAKKELRKMLLGY